MQVPTLQTLLRVEGSADAPVVGVTLRSIGFRDAAPTFMEVRHHPPSTPHHPTHPHHTHHLPPSLPIAAPPTERTTHTHPTSTLPR